MIRNVLRNQRRTTLTVASVTVSVCLLGVFCATYLYLGAPPELDSRHLILVVTARTALTNPLPRGSVLLSFMVESVLIAVCGGILGCLLALPINGMTTGTTNFVTLSEVAFNFRVTVMILLSGVILAALMGFFGGLFPAWRAASQEIVAALRSA